ncbi:MAG: hypothetical protein DRH07_08925 [Deltaproteobacteria bacterium]|nr:MAG: hypothetical protein DRH07_08925 [Deltaproteobacteria bacterium]
MKIALLHKVSIPLLLGLCLLLASYTESSAPIYQGPDIQIIGKDFYKDLESEFNRYSYQIDALENGVPPLVLQNLPGDLNKIQSTKLRKSMFFKAILPMVLLANDEIRMERNQLLKIDQQLSTKKTLTDQQLQILSTLSKRYKIKFNESQPERIIAKLLSRVDTIPEDLALAQAANESAWGTSRFSLVANNLFGQWTFIPGQGIIPKDRPEGETYEVRKFSTVYDSVRSYLLNLNTHQAYKQLRQLRTASRVNGQNPKGLKLAEGLLRYSTRGEDYVKELQAMIRFNQLSRFTTAKLRTSS